MPTGQGAGGKNTPGELRSACLEEVAPVDSWNGSSGLSSAPVIVTGRFPTVYLYFTEGNS